MWVPGSRGARSLLLQTHGMMGRRMAGGPCTMRRPRITLRDQLEAILPHMRSLFRAVLHVCSPSICSMRETEANYVANVPALAVPTSCNYPELHGLVVEVLRTWACCGGITSACCGGAFWVRPLLALNIGFGFHMGLLCPHVLSNESIWGWNESIWGWLMHSCNMDLKYEKDRKHSAVLKIIYNFCKVC